MTRTKRRVWQGGMVAGGIFLLLLPLLIQSSYADLQCDPLAVCGIEAVRPCFNLERHTGQNNSQRSAV